MENNEPTAKLQGVPESLKPYCFKPGESGNPEGRKPMTPEQKLQKKAIKQLVEEYKEALADYLPQVAPIFMAKVLDGDTASIKEYHDRVLDKAKQQTDITSNGNEIQPVLVKFIGEK